MRSEQHITPKAPRGRLEFLEHQKRGKSLLRVAFWLRQHRLCQREQWTALAKKISVRGGKDAS
jgi:hypothetical protein